MIIKKYKIYNFYLYLIMIIKKYISTFGITIARADNRTWKVKRWCMSKVHEIEAV